MRPRRIAIRPVRAPGAHIEPEHIATVLLNTGASVAESGKVAATERIREAFRARGWSAEIIEIPASRIAVEAPLRVRDARGTVVAAGGDGTVNIMANACRAYGRPLGILPLGADNLAARRLGVPIGIDEAAAIISDGEAVAVRFGELNGRLFLSSAGFGLYPSLLRPAGRGALANRGDRLAAMGAGMRMLLRSNDPFDVEIEAGIGRTAVIQPGLRTTSLHVSINGAEADTTLLQPQMAGPRGGLMLRGLARIGRWQTFSALAAAALGEGRSDAQHTTVQHVSRFVVHTRRKRVAVEMDGDLRWIEPPLEFRLRDSGLQIVLSRAGRAG